MAIDTQWIFSYHQPQGDQQQRYEYLRQAAKAFADAIIQCTQEGADQTAAIRKIREAVMTANASISLEKPL